MAQRSEREEHVRWENEPEDQTWVEDQFRAEEVDRRELRRAQQDEPGPRERRQRGGARRGL